MVEKLVFGPEKHVFGSVRTGPQFTFTDQRGPTFDRVPKTRFSTQKHVFDGEKTSFGPQKHVFDSGPKQCQIYVYGSAGTHF